MASNIFPDPNDRTPNEPYLVLTTERVINIYNFYNVDNPVDKLKVEVKAWMCAEAMKRNWDSCEWSGALKEVCLLGAHFKAINRV